jgi:ParB family chromosome partitioning protein
MIETLQIQLSKLVPWDGNVRKTGTTEGIDELAASIAAHGLLQTPVVRKARGGKYAVVAGHRRLRALRLLAEQGRIGADTPIACRLAEARADAGEISLAENVVRVAMHPADQFEAFRDLIERGANAVTIAARFGVSETTVVKRLKLGRLSPVILDTYRAGAIGLEEAQAFTISDDHQAQEQVLAELSDWNRNPSAIRRRLTEGEVSAGDRRVMFVGLEAYEAAGGAVRRDLFDDEASGTVLDATLLDQLVMDKLNSIADAVRAEGWAWVEVMAERDYGVLSQYRRIYPERVPLTDEQQSRRATLSEEHDNLSNSREADENDEATLSRLAEIEELLDEIDAVETIWSDAALAGAGAIVTLSGQSDVAVERGLIRRDATSPAGDDGAAPDEQKPRARAGLSAVLIEDLTARKTAALRVSLAANPQVALAAVVHALALQVFYRFARERTCLQVTISIPSVERSIANPDGDRALSVDADAEVRWAGLLPKDESALWPWCLAQTQDTLLALLAFLAGRTVDAVRRKADAEEAPRLLHAETLAQALSLDMTAWFVPDATNYFGRIPGAQIVGAMCEAKGINAAPAWAKMKKAELAALAAREVAGTGWLPALLRAVPACSDEAA